MVDECYPAGEIAFYPRTEGGISATFQHQNLNLQVRGRAWREGKLCLDSPGFRRSLTAGVEPVDDSDERIKWHAEKAISWLMAAATGTLVRVGDRFEVPWYPCQGGEPHLVHDESARDMTHWSFCGDSYGRVDFGWIDALPGNVVASRFRTRRGSVVRVTRLRVAASSKDLPWNGLWWKWPKPIVLAPWQAPLTWGELRKAGRVQSVDVDLVLRRLAQSIRDRGKHILLLGYPIPLRHGEMPIEIYWVGIDLPELKSMRISPKGFRPNELGFWNQERLTLFADDVKLSYRSLENWDGGRLRARGQLTEVVRSRSFALIGCGAVGSAVAELLVRQGITKLILIDDELLVAGNVVRHGLGLDSVDRPKVVELSKRLHSISADLVIEEFKEPLSTDRERLELMLESADVVLDCTGSDSAINALSAGRFSVPKLFVSLSTGFKAMRTFCFLARGCQFPRETFYRLVKPWLELEREARSESIEVIEGAGCWSPLFPARLDDIWIGAACAVKTIEERFSLQEEPELSVFEQVTTGQFTGVRRLSGTEVPRG